MHGSLGIKNNFLLILISSNNIKDKGLKEFCHSLVTHPELESLSLIIYE